MAADITIDKLGDAYERRGPGNSQRGNGIGDAMAAGRAETVRP